MAKTSAVPMIRLRGVRHNNLKNFDLDLPQNRLLVITGLSGSGKSSLAFDTLFAEGQRRYIETFSPYARQFFDRMDKPRVDAIEGIPPAIAIEQRNAVKSTRSTVGTMTEICDYMKLLWPQIAQLRCRQCGQTVRQDSPQSIWETLERAGKAAEWLITFAVPISDKLTLEESLALIAKQGYQRLLLDGVATRLEDARTPLQALKPASLTIIQDRLKTTPANRARFVEACEQAYHFGKGKLTLHSVTPETPTRRFSNRWHCATCDIEYREPSPALFSFNHPVGACPACKGFGRIITIDYSLAIPNPSKTLAEGAIKPWLTGHGLESQSDMMKFCRIRKIPTDVPFRELSREWQDWVVNGDPGYGSDPAHEWPRAWYGVKGYFRWLESKAYKMHVRVLLSRYRSYQLCPSCHGHRLQPEALLYKIDYAPDAKTPVRALSLSDFYQLPIRNAFTLVDQIIARRPATAHDPLALAAGEVRGRLGFLNEVGLGYLTLDRSTRSLSGGETGRVNLTTCLGTRLVNTLFVLDEPSVGLHPRDTGRLVKILEQLRDAGNTVVVVEHEASMMRAADQIIDIGPGHGAAGGQVVFQGPYREILRSAVSLTGQYLAGARSIPLPERRPTPWLKATARSATKRSQTSSPAAPGSSLIISHATLHNLKDLTVEIPLARLVCLTGVSGSGKTTLARQVLLPLLQACFKEPAVAAPAAADAAAEDEADSPEAAPVLTPPSLAGWESLGGVVLVDQSLLGRTPRSNPAVYIGAFEDLREFFAQSEIARQRGLNSSAFSFNSSQGQCERCRGAGFEKIEMQFLSDVFIRCPECDGRRYRAHILEIKIPSPNLPAGLGIADLLEATVEEAIAFFSEFPESRPARRAVASLQLLSDVGLGYLQLGQPINTLSGGESQRLKLVRHLAEFAQARQEQVKPTLFVFDEPTTGLHFDDVRVLLRIFQRLVTAGHSVLIVEHNLDVIKSADWVVDLGPDAGDRGGAIVAQGTPEQIAACAASHTGHALKEVLTPRR